MNHSNGPILFFHVITHHQQAAIDGINSGQKGTIVMCDKDVEIERLKY